MSNTTNQTRRRLVQDARDNADRLRHLPDLAATVRTLLTVVEDRTYDETDAVCCTEQLQRLGRTHNPRHAGTQTYADHIEGFCSQERRGCPACPAVLADD